MLDLDISTTALELQALGESPRDALEAAYARKLSSSSGAATEAFKVARDQNKKVTDQVKVLLSAKETTITARCVKATVMQSADDSIKQKRP